jgi:hypothetical protein
MRKKTIIEGNVDSVQFGFKGTEKIPIEKILKLTEGAGLEITAKNDTIKVTLNLLKTPFVTVMSGTCCIEVTEYEPTDNEE